MEVKFTIELEIPEETVKTLATAQLSLDDVVQTRIEQALYSLTKGATLVYRANQSKPLINLYKACPVCGHPWALHFNLVGPDGKKLMEPTPGRCPECSCMAEAVAK